MLKKESSKISKRYNFSFFISSFVIIGSVCLQFKDAITECKFYSVAGPGDGLGTTWNNFVLSKQGFPPWQGNTQFTNYPKGEPFWTTDWWISLIPRILSFFFSNIFGQICSYNIVAFLGILFSSISLLYLFYSISRNGFISAIATSIIVFGGFFHYSLVGHLNKLFLGGLALSLAFALRALVRDSYRNLSAFGLISGIAFYFEGYYSFLVVLVMVAYTSFAFTKFIISHADRSFKMLLRLFLPSFILILFISPYLLLFMTSSLPGTFSLRDANELNVYRLKLWHLFTPSPSNPVMPNELVEWQEKHLGGSNFSENGFYVTIPFLILFIFQIALILKDFKASRLSNKKWVKLLFENCHQFSAFLCYLLIITSIFAFVPKITILGKILPTPSLLLFEFSEVYRTISRFGILVLMCILGIGVLGFSNLIKLYHSFSKQIFLHLILLISMIIELGLPNSVKISLFDIRKAPASYLWIQKNTPKNSILLEYDDWNVDRSFFGWGTVHERKFANPFGMQIDQYDSKLTSMSSKDLLCLIQSREIDIISVRKGKELPRELKSKDLFIEIYPVNSLLKNVSEDRVYKVNSRRVRLASFCD